MQRKQCPAVREDSLRPVILIIDDDPGILRAVERVLRRDFEVLSAASLDDATGCCVARRVDAILCDLELGATDGVAVMHQLRATGLTAPAAMYTGSPHDPRIHRLLADGIAQCCLEKPAPPCVLVGLVSQLLEEQSRQPPESVVIPKLTPT